MNLILILHGYPPAIIRKEDRLAYLSSLEKAQLGGSKSDYEKLVTDAVSRSLDIYLEAVNARPEPAAALSETAPLMRIGALAKAAHQTVATIRFWTREGLLDVAEVTPSGYQLFDHAMIDRCAEIEQLKEQRLTIAEIRAALETRRR